MAQAVSMPNSIGAIAANAGTSDGAMRIARWTRCPLFLVKALPIMMAAASVRTFCRWTNPLRGSYASNGKVTTVIWRTHHGQAEPQIDLPAHGRGAFGRKGYKNRPRLMVGVLRSFWPKSKNATPASVASMSYGTMPPITKGRTSGTSWRGVPVQDIVENLTVMHRGVRHLIVPHQLVPAIDVDMVLVAVVALTPLLGPARVGVFL